MINLLTKTIKLSKTSVFSMILPLINIVANLLLSNSLGIKFKILNILGIASVKWCFTYEKKRLPLLLYWF